MGEPALRWESVTVPTCTCKLGPTLHVSVDWEGVGEGPLIILTCEVCDESFGISCPGLTSNHLATEVTP